MTRMTGPDCVVMCNLINTYIHTYKDDRAGLRGYVQFNKYIHTVLAHDVGRSGVHTRAQTLFGYFVPD